MTLVKEWKTTQMKTSRSDCPRLYSPDKQSVTLFTILLSCLICFPAQDLKAGVLMDTSNDSHLVLGGYGQSFPGWGETTQRVETVDVIFRHNHHIFEDMGSSWYKGFHSIFLEIPFHFVVNPDESAIVGLNFLAAYTFTANELWQPYLFGGGGPLYSFAHIPGMGAEWNGSYQFGGGVEYKLKSDHKLLFEFRYHHISNGGSEEPNEPLNSFKLLMGYTF